MQFGIGLPNLSYVDPTQTLFSLAQVAQELRFDSIWVSDHVFIPFELEPNYPYSATGQLGLSATDHILDPLTTLAFLAGRVDGPRLGISKSRLLPQTHPKTTPADLGRWVFQGGAAASSAGRRRLASE